MLCAQMDVSTTHITLGVIVWLTTANRQTHTHTDMAISYK